MEALRKKAACQESTKSNSKPESGSEFIEPLKVRRGSKIFKSRRKRPRLIEKEVANSLNKWTKKSSVLGGKKGQIKKLETKSLKKKSNFRFHGKNSCSRKSQGKENNIVGEHKVDNFKKRKRKIRQTHNAEQDEACRLQRRTRYLMIKMKSEQNLIDAYSGEGWKGQSREKIKPETELQRARKQILKCKLGIRDAIQQLDSLSSVGCIEDSVIGPDGSVYHEHIICAKCKSREAFSDNDIILCDGTCNCAFHQKCLDPPLDTKHIPPGDQGWFCKFCECKMEILESMNAHLGTHFPMDSCWEDIFKEDAAFRDGGNSLLNQEEDWPSDDAEDDDYNPQRREKSDCVDEIDNIDNASDLSSSSTSLSWSLDGEVFSGKDGTDYENLFVRSPLDSDDFIEGEVISRRRQRQSVDYRKLYDEMFGKEALMHEQVSEDEDWGPAKTKRREKESDAASTLITLYESDQKTPALGTEVREELQNKSSFRIPRQAIQLRQVFGENELPSKAVKQKLSEELGIDPEKVNKWFKNARYVALKARKAEGTKPLLSPTNSKEFKEEAVEKDDDDESASNDAKKDNSRKMSKATSDASNKKQHERILLRPCTINKDDELKIGEDDESLKKLLEERMKEKKKKNKKEKKGRGRGGEYKEAEKEMEKLCKMKSRLENMKQVLLEFTNNNKKPEKKSHKSSTLFLNSAVYVPVAHLKEKT